MSGINKIIIKIFHTKHMKYLFYSMIILSVLDQIVFIKNNLILHRTTSIIFSLIFFYFILARIFNYQKISIKEIIQNISFDEYLVCLICLFGLISGFLYNDISKIKNIHQPLLFVLSYIGISSYAKITKISQQTFIKILGFYLIIIFIHTMIEYIHTIPHLWSYLTNKINYAQYIKHSWDLSYKNYNYFSRNLMIGIIASISLSSFYFIHKKIKIEKFFYLISLLLFFLFSTTISMTYSRGSIFVSIIYIVLLGIYSIKNFRSIIFKRLKAIHILIIICLTLCCILLLIKFNFLDALITKTQQRGIKHRYGFWINFIKKEIEIFPDLKFFIGTGCAKIKNEFYLIWATVRANHVHNNFLFIWHHYGLIGMVFFIFMISKMLVDSFKKISEIWFIYFIPISYLIGVAFFETQLLKKNFHLEVIFFFIFLILPYNKYLQQKKQN